MTKKKEQAAAAGPGGLNTAGYAPEQAAALEALHANLEAFKLSFGAVVAVGIKPAEALEACGYSVPLFARPMVNTLLAEPA